jgi:predicted metal-dependent phosphoesterase TrpH
MTSSNVDLHCHSTASDGTLAPAAVVALAKERGLSALALTDHDTVNGVAEASAAAAAAGIDFLPGIEISAEFPHPGTLHILGYGVDPASPVLKSLTDTLIGGRDDRNPRIIEKLREHNVAITMAEVEAEANVAMPSSDGGPPKKKPIGRPHIAAILLRKGYVSSIKQAFDKYLAPGGLAYFDKERLAPHTALQMIRDSGGIAVLAHPIQLRYTNDAQLETVLKDLVDHGLGGIEVLHSDHDEKLTEQYTGLAKRYGLLTTGGSDFHGTNKKDIDLGTARGKKVPRSFFDRLREALAAVKPA